jgi:hypothetical protein
MYKCALFIYFSFFVRTPHTTTPYYCRYKSTFRHYNRTLRFVVFVSHPRLLHGYSDSTTVIESSEYWVME